MQGSRVTGWSAGEVWQDLLSVLWPTQCLVCATPNRDVCGGCLSDIRERLDTARVVPTLAGPARVAGGYEGGLRALLLGYKHSGLTRLSASLGQFLAVPLRVALREAPVRPPPLIVTVPSRRSRERERGYRHVDLLVRAALRELRLHDAGLVRDCHTVAGALRATPGRTSQVGLGSTDRMRNAARITVPRRMLGRLRGRSIVLVDDVITTGATVAAAALALERAGASVCGIVALCATERRDFRESVEVTRA